MRNRDEFLYFTYNGKHSSDYGVFYENNGEDISFPFSSNFSFEETSPLYQNRTYLLGGQKQAKTFEMNLFAENENWFETEEIFEWLNPGKTGELIIDFRPNYLYKVRIRDMAKPVIIPFKDKEGNVSNIINFAITFSTYGTHLAELKESFTSKEEWTDTLKVWLEPDFNFPIMLSSRKGIYDFVNWSSVNQYLVIEGRPTINFQTTKQDKHSTEIYYKHNIPTNPPTFKVDTELGAMVLEIEKDGKVETRLLESQYTSKAGVINKGPMAIEPSTVFKGIADLDIQGAVMRIKIDKETFSDLGNAHEYVAVLIPKDTQDTVYLRNGKISSNGQYLEFLEASKTVYKQKYKVQIAAATRIEISGPHDIEYKYRKGL